MTEFEVGLSRIYTPVLAGGVMIAEVADRITAGAVTAQDAEILREVAGNVNDLWLKLKAAMEVLDGE